MFANNLTIRDYRKMEVNYLDKRIWIKKKIRYL